MNTITRNLTRGIAGLGIVGIVAMTGAGLANAETPSTAPAPHVAASTGPSPSSYQGTWALTENITNNSGQDLTLYSATNDYGHWQQRPVNLPNGASETVSSYNDSPHVNATDEIDLTYTLPNGDYVQFDGVVMSTPIWNYTWTNVTDENEVGVTAGITHLDHAVATVDITNPNS